MLALRKELINFNFFNFFIFFKKERLARAPVQMKDLNIGLNI